MPAAAPRTSPWNPATTPAVPARAAGRCWTRASPGWWSRCPTPRPRRPGAPRGCARRGVEVSPGCSPSEAERVNAEWLTYARLGRPHVTWKFAATLDGRSAAADGTSQWITSRRGQGRRPPPARPLRRHRGRHRHRAGRRPPPDRPRPRRRADRPPCATTRRSAVPLRVVVDAEARTPPDAASWTARRPRWSRSPRTPTATGLEADLLRLPRHDGGGLDLRALLARAGRARGRQRVPGGRPDAGGRVPGARAWSTASSPTSRPRCSAPGPPRWATAGVRARIAEAPPPDLRRRFTHRAGRAAHRTGPCPDHHSREN